MPKCGGTKTHVQQRVASVAVTSLCAKVHTVDIKYVMLSLGARSVALV